MDEGPPGTITATTLRYHPGWNRPCVIPVFGPTQFLVPLAEPEAPLQDECLRIGSPQLCELRPRELIKSTRFADSRAPNSG